MDEFHTSDLQLASYLVILGHTPARIGGSPERRVFVFVRVPHADIASYYQGTHPVPPQPLFTAYRRMKRQLFQPV